MSDTIKHFRPPNPSPQPWKLDIELDLFEEYAAHEDDTQEFLITEPDDYMDDLEFEDEITEVYERCT